MRVNYAAMRIGRVNSARRPGPRSGVCGICQEVPRRETPIKRVIIRMRLGKVEVS